MTTRKYKTLLLLCVFLLLPGALRAQVVMSEIMYDLAEGSDTGREWVEIFNSGSSAIDITTWKLFEANSNHKISEFQGGAQLAGGAYAIIADNPAKFLADWPTYSGILFDSAFSLGNSGETLTLRDVDLVDKDTFSYTPDMGGAGDGNALSRGSTSANTWSAAAPSPGTGGLTTSGIANTATENTGTQTTETTSVVQQAQSTGSNFPVEPQIFAYAGKDRVVLVGADVIFEAKALSKDGDLLEGAGVRYLWNFGDGATSEDRTVAHHFSHPGNYVVVLDVSSGKYGATHRIIVRAEDPQLTITRLSDGGVRIENKSVKDADISYWHVQVGNAFFTIPKNTIVLSKGVITLRQDATKLPLGNPTLVYPNGVTVKTQEKEVEEVVEKEEVNLFVQEEVVVQPKDILVSEIVDDEEEIEELASTSAMMASPSVAFDALPSWWSWVLGLLGVIAIGGIGIRFGLAPDNKTDLDIKGWEIIDADEEVR